MPPTPTLPPSGTAISVIVPEAVALTSSVTLSVSSSTSGSSTATLSPIFLSHLATVASVTDSPKAGTRISAAILTSPARTALRVSLFQGQRVVDQLGLLFEMALEQTRCRRGSLGTTDIGSPLGNV